MDTRPNHDLKNSKAYLAGSGIASLASATFLTKDASMPGENIHILEQNDIPGGALYGAGCGFISVRRIPRAQ